MPVDFRTLFTTRYPAGVTTIYVAQTGGSDSNPGTSAQPKATIQGGLAAVGSTGTVLVRNGTYTISAGELTKVGTAGNWVRVMAESGQTPTIASPGNYQSLGIANSAYFAWYGFNITGVSSAASLDAVAVLAWNSHHIAIWKCNISNASEGILLSGGHHYDIAYNKIGPNIARYRSFSYPISFRALAGGGNDADGYSSRVIGNVVHDGFQESSSGQQGGSAVVFEDLSGRGGSGGTAGTDKILVGFNLFVYNGRSAIEANSSDRIEAYFNTLAHNVRQHGTTGTPATIGEIDADDSLSSIWKWNAISTLPGRATAQWFSETGATPDPVDNVILRGTAPALTGQRNATATGDAWFKSPNDAMTSVDGWRAAGTTHTISLDGASGGPTARDALQAWPDWFGELRPTASGNTWTLGFAEPTAPPPGSPPVANFTAAPNPANVSQTITFTDTSTNTPTSWLWNFGDGSTSTSQNPTKAYAAAGTYNVTLTATNASGSNGKTVQVVVSAPQNTSPYEAENATLGGGVEPPQVLTSGGGYSGDGYVGFFNRIGNFVQFSLSGLAAGTYALQLRWGKGDTGTATRRVLVNTVEVATLSTGKTGTDWSDPARWVLSTAVNVTLTGGTNTVRVEYSGSTDFQGIDLDRITVTPVTAQVDPPVANFIFSPNNPTPGALMTFTDTSTNSPTSWLWNFGDGTTSTAQNPTKSFANAGTYQVSLTATNSAGSNTRTIVVTVTGVVISAPDAQTYSITVTGNPLQNLTSYTAWIEVRDNNGIIGSDSEQFSTAWTPPPSGNFSVTDLYSTEGYVSVDWSDAAIDPDWVAWRVYHRVSGESWVLLHETRELASSYSYHDWVAPVGEPVQWAVVQVVERFGSEAESAYSPSTSLTLVSADYWLVHPTDETMNIKLHVMADRFLEEREQAVIPIIGRGRRVEFGTNFGVTGTLRARIRRDNSLTPRQQRKRLEELQEEATAMYLRTPFGQVWRVALANIPFDRLAGVGTEEMADIEITYNEVA